MPFVNKESSQIICSIIYIDNFGNVITNLDRTLFNNISKGRNFEISARNYNFNKIYKYLKFESGVHRVQRVPVTETQGRIHTSTATVAVLVCTLP